jgi:hypothetical protein
MHATGDYDTTKELLNRAVKFVGADTRRGGEYKLWLAQVSQCADMNVHIVSNWRIVYLI